MKALKIWLYIQVSSRIFCKNLVSFFSQKKFDFKNVSLQHKRKIKHLTK